MVDTARPLTLLAPDRSDTARFERLYSEHYDRLLGYCRYRLHETQLADDAAQEAMLRALKYLDSLDESRPSWPWLKMIANRVMIDLSDKREREPVLAHDAVEARIDRREAASGPDDLVWVEFRQLIDRAMDQLPRRHRTALRLRYERDMPVADVAAFMGITDQACTQLLKRARDRMRAQFDGDELRFGAAVSAGIARVRSLASRVRTRIHHLEPTWLTLSTTTETLAHAIATTAILLGLATTPTTSTTPPADHLPTPPTFAAYTSSAPPTTDTSHTVTTMPDEPPATTNHIARIAPPANQPLSHIATTNGQVETRRDGEHATIAGTIDTTIGPYDPRVEVPVWIPCTDYEVWEAACDALGVVGPGLMD